MNETLTTPNTNDIFISLIQQYLGTTVSDSFLFIAVMGIVFILIFMGMTVFMNTRAGVRFMAAYAPVLLVDGFKSFGTYTVNLPYFEYTFTHFVMTFKLIDYIFTFKILTPIMSIVTTFEDLTIEPSIWVVGITWMYSFGDSILQLLIFILAAYSILTLIENWFNKQIPYQFVVSVILGFIPVFLYANFFSNPFHEYEKSQIYITTFTNFLSNSSIFELLYFAILTLLSLSIIYIIVLMIAQFLLSTFITFSPKGKALDYSISYESVALLFTMFYAFLFMMHPEYTWYNIMLVILIWSGFKYFLDNVVSEANVKNTERKRQNAQNKGIAKEISSMFPTGNLTTMQRTTSKNQDNIVTTIIIPLLISIALIGVGLYLM